jgi:uncharacterized protein YbcC (UPF0753/DUF2309 family)
MRHHAHAADDSLIGVLDRLASLLPAQGPISIFIHHNPLHAFEHLPFEAAVEHAGRQLGTEPYLALSRYRDKLGSGRILAREVEGQIRDELGERGGHDVAGVVPRQDLWRAVVLHGVPGARGAELAWILNETSVLSRFRTDVPATARAAAAELCGDESSERQAVTRLWRACVEVAGRAAVLQVPERPRPVRHRDLLLAVEGIDTDAWIHPPLIRFLAGYLDQGLAAWVMPGRRLGIHGCFVQLYETRLAARCGDWARSLSRLVAEDRRSGRDALRSIEHSVHVLGVREHELEPYLAGELLALRGWAGIVRQIEERPDRVPVRDLTVTLRGYLAVRLLFERAALEYMTRELTHGYELSQFRTWLENRMGTEQPRTARERAWPLFHVAQLCGLDASLVEQWTADQVGELESELQELNDVRQRRILQQAFERTIRRRLYDALVHHTPRESTRPPAFQAVFCIDEREESFRRHLEEVAPDCETFGTAGFFNVAMYHQSVSDAHPRPLCPVAIRPDHFVAETAVDARGGTRRRWRHASFLGYNVNRGQETRIQGAVLLTLFGWLALLPLVARVVFPWLLSRWRRAATTATHATRTRLSLEREDGPPPVGSHRGFTAAEMADIVRQVLEDTGIATRLAGLVLVVGHGSDSLNNPHESAHDCGACGGGRGGPNARALAQMANDARVRKLLATTGYPIASSTWFVGAERNTSSNTVTFFDDDLVPPAARSLFDRAVAAIALARRRESHERCRRFDVVPAWYPPLATLAHVEGRAADLAQPRPEYGHATNAFCIVGRRTRTAGLFLDRRAFLVSYDPGTDESGRVLARILAAVVPVVAGINLEYYFSYVDPTGYGCGTKLPHNVTSLLGVMDGAQSDLRTGLPWQMVEIHEPTRLTIVVEADQRRVREAVGESPAIARLVENRWVGLACLDPHGGALVELTEGGFVPYVPDRTPPTIRGDSATWYGGKRGFLPPVSLDPVSPGPGAPISTAGSVR